MGNSTENAETIRENDVTRRLDSFRTWNMERGEPSAAWSSISHRAARRRRKRHVTRGALSVASLALVFGVALVVSQGSPDGFVVSTDTTNPTKLVVNGFSQLGPGWHELDTGPVPETDEALAWTGEELVVATEEQAFAYSPETQEWRRISDLPLEKVDAMVATDDAVIAIGKPDANGTISSASWDPDLDIWTKVNDVPIADELTNAGGLGIVGQNFGTSLLWTGERVIDGTHGAVYDPSSQRWSVLALPSSVIEYSHLSTSQGVIVGGNLFAISGSAGVGLSWNEMGDAFRDVPGPPDGLLGTSGYVSDSSSVVADGKVVVGDEDGLVAAWDPRDEQWLKLPMQPNTALGLGCPRLASTGLWVLSMSCDGLSQQYLNGDSWVATEKSPYEIGCCITEWIDVDGAIVVWDSSIDTENNEDAPYVQAQVWVPPHNDPTPSGVVVQSEPTTTQ